MADPTLSVTPEVAAYLEMVAVQTKGLEFSGLGFIRRAGLDLLVYEVEILHVGSWGASEIDIDQVRAMNKRPNAADLKLWFHRHPVGDGIPGQHNWSSTDETTIQEVPLGGLPELVKWSASIVRTPLGWVGRLDDHVHKGVLHLPVGGFPPAADYLRWANARPPGEDLFEEEDDEVGLYWWDDDQPALPRTNLWAKVRSGVFQLPMFGTVRAARNKDLCPGREKSVEAR